MYVAVVLDLFSRRVVGWSMSNEMPAQPVTDALVMALWRQGKPKELLHHSDQGSLYTSEQFQRLLVEQGVVSSMTRSGDVWNNSAMESFFSSLKEERVSSKAYQTRHNKPTAMCSTTSNGSTNPYRRHSTIGYVSPAEFDRSSGLA